MAISAPIVRPPARPGWGKGSNSGIIVASAGAFKAPSSGRFFPTTLYSYADAGAVGPGQVADEQAAASAAAAADTLRIPLDTVGAATGTKYKVMVTYRILGPSDGDERIAMVSGGGTVTEAGGFFSQYQLLNPSTGAGGAAELSYYSMIEPADNPFGVVLKTASGQTLKLRAFHGSGGSVPIALDIVFLFPIQPFPTSPFGMFNEAWEEINDPPYDQAADGWNYPGYGGLSSPFGYQGAFPGSGQNWQVGWSNGVTAPENPNPNATSHGAFDTSSLGVAGSPQNLYVTARVLDPAKGPGKLRIVSLPDGGNPTTDWQTSPFVYSVPPDGNVYMIRCDKDPLGGANGPDNTNAFQIWTPDDAAQAMHVDLMYQNLSDPGESVVFGGDGHRLGD